MHVKMHVLNRVGDSDRMQIVSYNEGVASSGTDGNASVPAKTGGLARQSRVLPSGELGKGVVPLRGPRIKLKPLSHWRSSSSGVQERRR